MLNSKKISDRYTYPAIFKRINEGCGKSYIDITFPDLNDVFTFADDMREGIDSAKDALQLILYEKELRGILFNKPSDLSDIVVEPGEVLVLIDIWNVPYKNQQANKSVNKTLTIPAWLNELAEMNGINFSQSLQASLKSQLGIDDSEYFTK